MSLRLNLIRNLLLTEKQVFVNDLSRRFQVSTVTIRKDLAILEDEGIALRVYGGAALAEKAFPPSYGDVSDSLPALLAEKACGEIKDGDNIFLGSGRTCCCLAKLLNRFSRLSVVTNNITALNDLLKNDVRLYLLGGEVTSTDGKTLFSSPENPDAFTDNIYVSKAFTSISGIDLQAGLTVHSKVSAHIYRHLSSICRSWYLMTDHTKFDQIAMYPVASLKDIRYLITDRLPDAYRDAADACGIQIR